MLNLILSWSTLVVFQIHKCRNGESSKATHSQPVLLLPRSLPKQLVTLTCSRWTAFTMGMDSHLIKAIPHLRTVRHSRPSGLSRFIDEVLLASDKLLGLIQFKLNSSQLTKKLRWR